MMKTIQITMSFASTIAVALISTAAHAQSNTPGFNNPIPEKIMTPDSVSTRIGTLEFVDGVPTEETTQMVYDHLDFLRGVEVFLNFIPATSLEGFRLGQTGQGAVKSNQAVIPIWALFLAFSFIYNEWAVLDLNQ